MISEEDYQEMKQDAYTQARQEEYEERQMRTDFDYAMETVASNFELQDAYDQFEKAAKMLSDYGHEMSPLDVFKEM